MSISIKINKEHKSIPNGLDFNLPIFTVITGENGSGKTHLFEAISNNQISNVSINNNILKNISFIPFNQLLPQSPAKYSSASSQSIIDNVWNQLSASQDIHKHSDKNFDYVNLDPSKDPVLNNNTYIKDNNIRKNIRSICFKLNKMPSDIVKDDITSNIHMIIGEQHILKVNFSALYKTYRDNCIRNNINKMYKDEGKALPEAEYLDDEGFKEKFGDPPWDFVNKLFSEMGLPFKTNDPSNLRENQDYDFKIFHSLSNKEIFVHELSTGEQTLLSLAFVVYNLSDKNIIPDLIVLDEPDAALHPSFSKIMLDILEKNIVTEMNIPIIISTHSPSTVACASPKSLYKITRELKRPTKTTLDDTMKFLAHALPNMRINISQSRYVFVESRNDVEIYTKLFELLQRVKEFKYTDIKFIPAKNGNDSNCEDVKSVAKHFEDEKDIYGLIDYDNKNNPSDNIIVLGKKYAIENYIFEPHIMGLYFLREQMLSRYTLDTFDLQEVNYLDLCSNLTQKSLQKIVNKISIQLFDEIKDCDTQTLINEMTLNIDKRFISMQGHDLEKLYIKKFPFLNQITRKGRGYNTLKKEIINVCLNEHITLLSKDILDTFNKFNR